METTAPANRDVARESSWLVALRRDPPALLGALVFLVFVGLYSLPVVSSRALGSFITSWADPILIGLAVFAFQYGKSGLHPEERNFWNLMSAAFVCYSGGVWLGLLVPAEEWGMVDRVTEDVFFLMQFVLMFLALSLNPHTEESNWSLNSLRFRLESVGTISFASLVFVYFVLVPLYFGDATGSALPSRAMFVALEPLLIFSFLYIASYSSSRRWATIYRMFGIGLSFWLLSDAVEVLTWSGIINLPGGIPYGTVYDFLWYAPFGFAVVAARLGRARILTAQQPAPGLPARNSRQIRYIFGPLAVYTTSLPLIHFAISALGYVDASSRSAREVCVLFGLLLLGSLTLMNEKLIERQRQRTETENKRLAAFPIKNPNPFLTFSGDGSLKYLNPAATRTVRELGLESVDDFLPPQHGQIVTDCMLTRCGFRDIEVEACDRVFSFGYYPDPASDDVFVYVMDITERKLAEGKLKHDALHDTLSGLPNRALVMEILSRAIERASRNPDFRFAVLFLDLNRFKLVNDSLGHLAGDRFLIEISRRIERCLRKHDVVGRFGGDEFVIVVDSIKNIHEATATAQRIQETVALPLTIEGQEIVTSACIGITFSDLNRSRPEDYLRDADIAMYRAKARGTGGFEVFDQRMHDDAVSRLKLENHLRRAIDTGSELALYYQPYVSLIDGRVLGFEGLIRWHHPELGMVSPAQFIPMAEDTGLIVPIGYWVIEQACQKLVQWSHVVDDDADLTVSVNVSSRQLGESEFPHRLEEILAGYDFRRDRLCLEITESVVSDLGDKVIATLESIKATGVKLAVDDFGTGYSSLSYLRSFPVDVLKIDRAFVSAMEKSRRDVAIVRTIATLAKNLDLRVIAEGIETIAQASKLRSIGCRVAQGYLYSMPVPAASADEILRGEVLGTPNRKAG